MAKKLRQMPKAGFYVMPPTDVTVLDNPNNIIETEGEIIYTTGIRGGGGHKFLRLSYVNDGELNCIPNDLKTWPTLQWSCVPGKDEIKKYTYTRTIEDALHLYNVLPHQKYP